MLEPERRTVVDRVADLARLTPGRTGNLSVRSDEYVAITPSGQPYDTITVADVPVVTVDGDRVAGEGTPSSELPMHRALYGAFDAGAVAHTHSPWATTLAVCREALPPVHYMLALAGGRVPVADYATYGSEELGENVVAAMAGAESTACLLANHGLVAVGDDVADAMETVVAVESVAQVYCQACTVGTPEPLPEAELARVERKLAAYGDDRGES
ncbi:class II aldolase/adducin family protein [Haloplanus litoreus]|uniref:Class II aldolase/adducin family protein n=1 Tax=Haloplanus litoreus TaxID=767515 RepID=A0ABD6A1W7_9EURY